MIDEDITFDDVDGELDLVDDHDAPIDLVGEGGARVEPCQQC
jgi:hypothetical protein